jgi:hypothetical protein
VACSAASMQADSPKVTALRWHARQNVGPHVTTAAARIVWTSKRADPLFLQLSSLFSCIC